MKQETQALTPLGSYLKGDPRYHFAKWVLIMLAVLAIGADFWANDRPIVAHYQGKTYFPVTQHLLVKAGWAQHPAFLRGTTWKALQTDWAIWPLIAYGPREQDTRHISARPGTGGHLLGTDPVGRDLLAGMVHATRIVLWVGLIAMAIATALGLFFGSLAGYWGDNRMNMSRGKLLLLLASLPIGWFYGFTIRQGVLEDALGVGWLQTIVQVLMSIAIIASVMVLFQIPGRALKRWRWWQKPLRLPWDIGVNRLIEVTVSVPVIFLVIMVLAMAGKGSLFWVMAVIGLTRWTGIARLVRAELLSIRQLEYVDALRAMGFREKYILWRHALPNALPPVLIAIAFGLANAILLEAFLSFIGLGVPPDVPTWGSYLNMGREHVGDWWLAVFPGLAIFITVLVCNLMGESLTDALQPGRNHRVRG